MAVYYYVLFLLPLAIVAALIRSRQAGTLILVVTAFSTFMISGLRWASDIDHLDYAEMFIETPDLKSFSGDSIRDLHGEPGYLFLTALLKSIGLNFIVLSVLCAFASVFIKTIVAQRFTRNASLVFCLYLCIHFVTIEFIQIRWAVASAFIALATLFQFRRQFALAAASIVIATSFHYFSLIYIFVVLIAEVRSEAFFRATITVLSLIGLVLAIQRPIVQVLVESDIYIVKRTFRYLAEPLSNVGLLSYAKLGLLPVFYLLISIRNRAATQEPGVKFLRRIAFASIAVTLLLSFVPLMHFRAVVLADFFGLLLLARLLEQNVPQLERFATISSFGVLYAIWYVQDIANYVAADRLYEYKTWIDFVV